MANPFSLRAHSEELCFLLLDSDRATQLRDLLETGTITIIRQHWHTFSALTSTDSNHGSSLRPSAMSIVSSRDGRSQLASVAEDTTAEAEDDEGNEGLHNSQRDSWASSQQSTLGHVVIPTSRTLFRHPNRHIDSADLSRSTPSSPSRPSASTSLAPATNNYAVIHTNHRDVGRGQGGTEPEERGRVEQRYNLSLRLGNTLNAVERERRVSLQETVKVSLPETLVSKGRI